MRATPLKPSHSSTASGGAVLAGQPALLRSGPSDAESQRAATPRAAAWRLWAAALVALAGCAATFDAPPKPPDRNAIVFDQLTIYSNFPLPPHHRLLEDLRWMRGQLLASLALPSSSESIHVYLFESEERFTAFVRGHYPSFPLRRAFFVKSDTRLAVYAQWGDRVAEDLRHEVAHGYLHSVVPNIPLWVDEGLAEYFEVPRGAAGVNQPHVQLLAAECLQQTWRPDIERLEQLTSAANMTQEQYAESWLWVHWLLESDAENRRILQDYLRLLRSNSSLPRLGQMIRARWPYPEQALVEHLHRLAR